MRHFQQPLNQWLISYIQQYQDKKSRYEIDRYLIEAGYNPTEIEIAWHYIQNSRDRSETQKIEAINEANKEVSAVLRLF